ncbi:metallo-beta-lactamase domain protein, partial [gut metagenome]
IDKPGHGLPQLDAVAVESYERFNVGSIEFMAIPVYHGDNLIAGYRFGTCAYITDVSNIQLEKNGKYLEGLDVLILGALREKPHPTHYSFSQAAEVARQIGAKANILYSYKSLSFP